MLGLTSVISNDHRLSSDDRQEDVEISSPYHDYVDDDASITLQLMDGTTYSKQPVRRKALWGLGCCLCLFIL